MPRVKKWSTGSIGNQHPDHSERNNPNTRGLSIDGVPGIEGYIEEDRVIADQDNRPIENLSQNDQVLERNLSSVASEVDYGVLRNKDEEFRIEILSRGEYTNPEDESELIETTPLRIHSGQAIVDGQVTSVGNQKIIYFLKDDGSYLFPDYAEHEGKTVIPVSDDLYDGNYKPVYDTLADNLPNNFEAYEIKITNKYDSADDRITFFKVYRNWEDIIPYTPHSTETEETLNFVYDENYGRESEGVWLEGNNVDNVKISNVVVKKNIQVKDKLLKNFIQNGSFYEKYIVTDGIFFDNIEWKTATQEKLDVQDLYATEDNSLYFVYKHQEPSENLFYLPVGSTQASNISLSNAADQAITRIIGIGNILFVLGTNGYFKTYDMETKTGILTEYNFFSDSTENFRDVTHWQDRIWITTERNIYHVLISDFNETSGFTTISFGDDIQAIAGNNVVERINIAKPIYGNFFVDSSLKVDSINYIKNSSFEKGGIGETPTYWTSSSFEISSSNAYRGTYKALLGANENAYQEIINSFAIGQGVTFSVYLKSLLDTDASIIIEELDDEENVIASSENTISISAGSNWERFNISHIVTNTGKIRVKIENKSSSIIQVDAVQLEDGLGVGQYVEGFEYLFIGFSKVDSDSSNPPFAFIDSKRLDQINYTTDFYGEIKTVNDCVFDNNNKLWFVDDTSVYTLVILNDEDEYNRITIKNITKEDKELNIEGSIDRLNTIERFDDRIFFGGNILNKTISFTVVDTEEEHQVKILDADDPLVQAEFQDSTTIRYNITDLLGDFRIVPAHGDTGAKIEFSRIERVYEARSELDTSDKYRPNGLYLLAVQIDKNTPIIITIQMPALYEGPISIEEIYNKIIAVYSNEDIIMFNLDYSKSRVDGLYSIGKNKLTRHIRGNIQRIFKQNNVEAIDHYDKGFYIILEDAILRSKYDPNVKKQENGEYINQPEAITTVDNITQLPTSANTNDIYYVKDFGYYRWDGFTWIDNGYIHKWNLSDTEHSLREFKNKYNQSINFNEESLNKNWVDLPITEGYALVPGTLRVKTNTETEIGFSENEDYFVDYENNKIIRSTLNNYLQDSNFEYVDSTSTSWESYVDNTNADIFINKEIDFYYSFDSEEKIVDSFAAVHIESETAASGAVYQFVKPPSLNSGDTYTFSVKLKSNKTKIAKIAISECSNDSSAFTTKNDATETLYEIGAEDDQDDFNEWHYYTVSHTVTNSSSQYLRVEVYTDTLTAEKLFIKEAQLERNQIATPYVKESVISRIDGGMTVYVDFTEYKNLVDGDDYFFDTANRKVVYSGLMDEDTELYFDYQYEKIFNPFVFQTSIPRFDVKTDEYGRDDYFLYLYSGRIWAINFVLSLLSQDEENPLIVEYNYHYPRIDKIKIRNNPDQYGNYIYLVKGESDEINPYGPYDRGNERITHTIATDRENIEDTESNDMIYEINVVDFNYEYNDIYDRRVYVDSRDNRYYNISLYDQTVGYFPYTKDFMSTSGMNPLNRLYNSKIVDIIKNFDIQQLEEIGAWGPNYQLALRSNEELPYPATGLALFVDVNSGNDTSEGETFTPLKTIKEAVRRITEDGASPYIIVKSEGLITEDIEINHTSEIQIFAQTYARWKGNIQNKTSLAMKGFQFERHSFYAINNLRFHYCTFINSSINNYVPRAIEFKNCKIENGNNTFLYVKNTIFPSPFLHPYQKNVSADDGIVGNPKSAATSDSESIHPSVSSYLQNTAGNPSGEYVFRRCLVVGLKDDFIKYELKDNEPWISEFIFEKSTIVRNKNLFYTNKSSQLVRFNECILWENGEIRGTLKKQFDSESNINFQNSYIDFSITDDSSTINFNNNGLIFGRETCVNGEEFAPGFVSTQPGFESYRLQSEAMGYLTNSICIGRAVDGGDLGCYDELRERLDIEVPKKLKSYFALIGEGIHYPIILNSEKITFTLEFKPSNPFSVPSVLFDTRSGATDEDFVIVVYNNNSGDRIADIDPNPETEITDPYSFKIIVGNAKTRYVVVSPIQIYSDADYQVWHKLSFTVNYEKVINNKTGFDEKDKYQNIITMYHNEELAVESFLKNDLSYDEHNEILEGYNNDNTNDWNYNNISRFITIGSTYDQQQILTGYYSEFRIDNRFISRKELEAWNKKVVPFNDPITYIDQNNLVRTFDSTIINDLWTLKTKYDIGAKGHRFNENTEKRFTYDEGEFTWVLTGPTTNFIANPDLTKSIFASVITDEPPNNDTENLFPVVFNFTMTIKTSGGNTFDSTTGVVIDFTDSGTQFYSHDEINEFLQAELAKPENAPSKIKIEKLKDNRFQIFTQDYLASQIHVVFENGGDAEEFGFSTLSGQGNGYTATDNSPEPGQKTIEGGKDTSIEIVTGITQALENEHKVWLNFNPEYTHFSPMSLGISRVETINNSDETDSDRYITVITHRRAGNMMGLYDESEYLDSNEYTYSIYFYRKSNNCSTEDIRVIVQEEIDGIEENYEEAEYEFDSIENIYGYWWLAQKTIRLKQDQDPNIGFVVRSELEIFIDAIQLEQASFATPFVLNSNANHGMIEIDKALFTAERGSIFFRFKPMFKYNTREKKVLLEALAELEEDGVGVGQSNPGKGFKIWYEFDEEVQKGKLQFRTSAIENTDDEDAIPDEAAWEITALEQFWNQWHTVVISYDFNTKRFIYFFDYFKNTADVSIAQYDFFTNVTIGRNAITGFDVEGNPEFPHGSTSADIMVRDILVTNYTVSDNEIKNWINAHEFYKEAIFNSLLNTYQVEMYDAIDKIEGVSKNTQNIEQTLNHLAVRMDTVESLYDSDIDLTLIKVRQDELRNEVYHDTIGILKKLQILDEQRINHDARIIENRNDNIAQDVLIQENTDNIAAEVSARISAINNLISRLASTTLGNGASMIGVHDPNNKFGATNVEAVLLEIEDRVAINEVAISGIQTDVATINTTIELMQHGDGSANEWTESKATNNGWNIGALRVDVNANQINIATNQTNIAQEIVDRQNADIQLETNLTSYIDTQVADLAGPGRTIETIKDNWDLIQANILSIADITTNLDTTTDEVNKVKDGTDGSTWNDSMNLVAHGTRLDTLDAAVATNTIDIQTNTTDITNIDGRTTNLETALAQEVSDRQAADISITDNLASTSNGFGASLVGIEDAAGSFSATDVEGALQEIDGKLQALSGSLNWQASVPTPADLPSSNNNLNDVRIVQDDGDGKRAQYVWNGTSWVKVADVDWGDASGVVYNNSDSGLLSTNVKSAIDELYDRSVSPNNNEEAITAASMSSDTEGYYYDFNHGLETHNIAVRAVDSSGNEIGVDEYERIDTNTVRVRTSEALDMTISVFGAHNSYSKIIGNWTPSSGVYVKDVVHSFGTQKIMISVFNITTGERVGVENIETLDENAIRIMTANNSDVLNVFILKQTSNATTKDIEYWVPNDGMYESILPLALDYDAVYSFYDPSTNKTVEVDTVKFENGILKITRTENTPLRMVVLK